MQGISLIDIKIDFFLIPESAANPFWSTCVTITLFLSSEVKVRPILSIVDLEKSIEQILILCGSKLLVSEIEEWIGKFSKLELEEKENLKLSYSNSGSGFKKNINFLHLGQVSFLWHHCRIQFLQKWCKQGKE